MQAKSGIWIDHKEAFIVFATPDEVSGVEKHVKFSGHTSSHEGAADDQRERHKNSELGKYYDEVISHVQESESILLFGPGEAKGELEKRLESKGLGKRVVGVETADKMTDHQIAAKVRQHYQK
jgi:stalled ribosome rescue protein Dom34